MKSLQTIAKAEAEKLKLWQKTSYGKLIRKSLKTDVLSVAKLRLSDEEKKYRQVAQRQLAIQRGRGQMTFDEALDSYRARLAANTEIKSKTKHYYKQRIDSLLRTWPSLKTTNVRDISKQNCLDWAAKYKGSATAFNNTALVLRKVLDIAVESGVIYENTARH